MLKLFYKQVLPFFQKERIIEKIAVTNLHLVLNQEHIETLNFSRFCEFLASFAFLWTEHTTVASAISLVQHLLARSRVTKVKRNGKSYFRQS